MVKDNFLLNVIFHRHIIAKETYMPIIHTNLNSEELMGCKSEVLVKEETD